MITRQQTLALLSSQTVTTSGIRFARCHAGIVSRSSTPRHTCSPSRIPYSDDPRSNNDGISFAGYTMGSGTVPYIAKYGEDDRVYFNDFTGNGQIMAVDNLLTTNQMVLGPNNYANNPVGSLPNGFLELDITGMNTTTNQWIWFADYDTAAQGGLGVYAWQAVNGFADPNNTTGALVVAVGGTNTCVYGQIGGIAVDENHDVFVAQKIINFSDPNPRVILFTNWDGVDPFTTNYAWAVGTNDDTFRAIMDIALDSKVSPKYLACAMISSGGENGIRILNVSDGSTVTTLDNGVPPWPPGTGATPGYSYRGCAWDNVGNVYGVNDNARCRAFSPPGPSTNTTVAYPALTIPAAALQLQKVAGQWQITWTGAGGASASGRKRYRHIYQRSERQLTLHHPHDGGADVLPPQLLR